MSSLPDMEELWDNSKGLLIPGMAAGAGGAGLGAYLTSKRKKGETPSDRRKRVLRNAMIGAAAGTTAGSVLPAGINMINNAGSGGFLSSIGDSTEDLITNAALMGTGGALGLAGGVWAKDKILSQADEAIRINTEVQNLYNNMVHGKKAKSITQFVNSSNPDVKEMLNTLRQGARSNTQDFFDDAIRKTRGKFRVQFEAAALKEFTAQYMDPTNPAAQGISKYQAQNMAKMDVKDLMKRDSVKNMLSLKAEDSVRRAMVDMGLNIDINIVKSKYCIIKHR